MIADENMDRVAELLDEALKLDTAEREIYLQRECVGNPVLMRRVEELIEASERGKDFLRDLDFDGTEKG